MTLELNLTPEQIATIPGSCLVHGSNVHADTNILINGERYLAGKIYCARTPVLPYQEGHGECPAEKTCILHKFADRTVLNIEPLAENEQIIKDHKIKENVAIGSGFADGC